MKLYEIMSERAFSEPTILANIVWQLMNVGESTDLVEVFEKIKDIIHTPQTIRTMVCESRHVCCVWGDY